MPISNNQSPSPAPLAARVLTTVFGVTFAGIGLAVLASLWGVTGFFEPPLFFKVVGSLIALPFIAFGVVFLIGGLTMKGAPMQLSAQALAEQLRDLRDELPASQQSTGVAAPATNYTCPHCAAPLASSSDASPHGDVKCRHCDTWFNIYGK